MVAVVSLVIDGGKSPVGVYKKGGGVTVFFMFSKQFLSYYKERMQCLPGWYFISFVIYLTTIDNNIMSIPFIDLAIFSIQWSKSGVEVPTDQVPCKTIGITGIC